jgi:aryl-alcohol dehydrogenase-like predicted oxidoreductase
VYKDIVRYHCSVRTEKHIEELAIGYKRPVLENGGQKDSTTNDAAIGTGAGREQVAPVVAVPLEEFCLEWLMRQPQVDCVLNGITKEAYASGALSVLRRHTDRPTPSDSS